MKQQRVKVRFGEKIDTNGFEEAIQPGPKAAQRLNLHYLAILSDMGWTAEAKALQTRLIADEEFQENAQDILQVNMQGPRWIDTFFKIAANAAIAKMKERERTAYDDNTQFGMF